MKTDDALWTAKQVSEYLNVGERQVAERYAFIPGFPASIRLPSLKGQGLYRWKKSDILAWVDRLQKAR